MNFKELLEGTEPKMPGAPGGIKIMTPQQFVASAGDMPKEEPDEKVSEGGNAFMPGIQNTAEYKAGFATGKLPVPYPEGTQQYASYYKGVIDKATPTLNKGTAGSSLTEFAQGNGGGDSGNYFRELASAWYNGVYDSGSLQKGIKTNKDIERLLDRGIVAPDGVTRKYNIDYNSNFEGVIIFSDDYYEHGDDDETDSRTGQPFGPYDYMEFSDDELSESLGQGMAESQEHLDRIRKLSGLGEATKLPAQTRDLGGQEFQDYMNRIVGTPDLDKSGNVKVDKKGNEKYVSGKTKSDKYKMPYIHRSSVVTYLSPDGKTYNEDAVKQTLAQRPKSLLKQNEKMKHSNGELEQFFNVGFAALVGIALDEQTNNLIIVNTCPGAGSCKIECFAMKGGKIQFKAAWQSDGRILTYLLNDPDGFFNQLSSEISKEEQLGKKGGYKVTIRWHDAGDFFSPEYQKLAFDMAAKHPDTMFYAYTKIAKAALGDKPDNFTVNWSEGAHTSQEKQIKANDANLDTTKNSRIVPDNLFQDLLIKDEKGNLVKGGDGQWQVQPEKLPELKQRLAKQYQLSSNSILSYDEYTAKRKSIPAGMKYNVIVAPGEGDISANDPNIISTLLLRH